MESEPQLSADSGMALVKSVTPSGNRLHQQLLQLMPAGVYTCDLEGRITFFNERAVEIWGRRPEVDDANHLFCGSVRAFLSDGSPLPNDEGPMAEAVRLGCSFRNEEVVFERPDGSRLVALVNIDPISDVHGNRSGAINVFTDITQLRRTEDELKSLNEELERRVEERTAKLSEMDERLSLALEVGCIGVWDWNIPEDKAEYNDAYRSIYGLKPDCSTSYDDWSMRIFESDRQRTTSKINSWLDRTEPYGDEFRIVRPDGAVRWICCRGRVLHDEHGRPVRMIGVNIDVTAERQFQDSEERFRTVVEEAPIPIIVHTIDGEIITVSRELTRQTGYTTGDVSTMVDWFRETQALTEDEAKDEYDQYVRLLSSDDPSPGRALPVKTKSQTIREWVMTSGLSGRLADGRACVSAMAVDLTELNHRTIELMGATEYEQRRIGRDIHDTTCQELTGLSFIVRSLVNQLSRDEEHTQLETARLVEEGIQRSLLQVRRFAQGLVPVELDDDGLMVALRELVTETQRRYSIQCEFHCPEPVQINNNTAATQLFLIGREAINNAIKHANADHIRVELTHDSSQMVMQIEDDGVGFASRNEADDGMGLRIMSHRAGLVRASFDMSPGVEGGTIVRCVRSLE